VKPTGENANDDGDGDDGDGDGDDGDGDGDDGDGGEDEIITAFPETFLGKEKDTSYGKGKTRYGPVIWCQKDEQKKV